MGIQIVFYWIGSIALGLMGVFMIVMIILAIVIANRVAKIARTIETIGHEAGMVIDSAKSRIRGMGAGMAASILGTIIKMMRNRD